MIFVELDQHNHQVEGLGFRDAFDHHRMIYVWGDCPIEIYDYFLPWIN